MLEREAHEPKPTGRLTVIAVLWAVALTGLAVLSTHGFL